MKQLISALEGLPVPHPAQTEEAMSQANDGWRKPDPRFVHANRFAEEGKAMAIEKGRAIVAVKRVGAYIGLKAADLLLLDQLMAFTQAQDWQPGRRAIVWPSNGLLMEQTGFALSTLKRHARRLAEKSLITFRDSPNGKRWGRRNKAGHIVEAYGYDLTPLAARAEEFEDLAARIAEERARCQQLKRQITVTRRAIRALLEAGQGACEALWAQFEKLLERLPGRRRTSSGEMEEVYEGFVELYHAAEAKFKDSNEPDQEREMNIKMNPKSAKNEPHTRTYKLTKHTLNKKHQSGSQMKTDKPSRHDIPIAETNNLEMEAVDIQTKFKKIPWHQISLPNCLFTSIIPRGMFEVSKT